MNIPGSSYSTNWLPGEAWESGAFRGHGKSVTKCTVSLRTTMSCSRLIVKHCINVIYHMMFHKSLPSPCKHTVASTAKFQPIRLRDVAEIEAELANMIIQCGAWIGVLVSTNIVVVCARTDARKRAHAGG